MKNICIVGCGKIGQLHAKNLKDRAHLYFHSRTPESAHDLCGRMGGSGVMEEYEQVVSNEAVDAVVLASPPQFHCAQTIKALQSGKAVLAEKPLCTSPAELTQIEAAYGSQQHALLMVAENYYYKPSLARIKELIADDGVGTLERVEVQKLFSQSSRGWRSSYGSLLEGGIHFVALVSDIVDDSPTAISARFPGQRGDEPERHAELQLSYERGVRATLRYAWDRASLTRGLLQHSRIIGSRGRIVFESNGLYAMLTSAEGRKFLFPNLTDLMGYGQMTTEFLLCLDDRGTEPYSNLARARRDLGVIFQAYGWNSGPQTQTAKTRAE